MSRIEHNLAVQQLLQHWQKHCQLEDFHQEWIEKNSDYKSFDKQYILPAKDKNMRKVYYVCEGLMAHIHIDEDTQKRHIHSIALPKMAIMTTPHLYSYTIRKGPIICLRRSKILAFSYTKILKDKNIDRSIATFMDILANKTSKHLHLLRDLNKQQKPIDLYLDFCEQMPELCQILTQQEACDLLGISRSSITRAVYFSLTGKHKR